MKKIIIALCSLALSCAGTFGINQLVPKDMLNIDQNIEQVNEDLDAEKTEDMASLPDNGETAEENEEKEEKASEVEVAAPETENKTDDVKVKEEKSAFINTDKTSTKTDNKNNSTAVTDKKTVNNDTAITDKKTVNNDTAITDKKTVNNNTAVTDKKTVNNDSVNKNSVKTATVNINTASNNSENKAATDKTVENKSNGNVIYIYKNIDLSGCNSTKEVVEKLQENGYQNINMNNVNNIGSLEDILSLINQKNSNGSNKNTATTTTPGKTTTNNNTTTTPKETTETKTNETSANSQNTNPSKATTNNSDSSYASYAEEVLRLVNVERSKQGLSPLTTTTTLKAAADKRAQETAVSFSHTRPNGTTFSTVLKEYGISYRTAGENIAYGQRTPQEVVTAWMNSSGHRANILNGNFNKIGIGVYQKNGVIYWSQLFTN